MSKFRTQHMEINWHELISRQSKCPAVKASLKEKSTLVGRVGLMMLSAGTGAWRVRASMNKTARALGIICSADIGLLTIDYTCIENGEACTNAISLSTTGINTDKLDSLEHFADSFAELAAKHTSEELHTKLDRINKLPPNYKARNLALAAALACCGFTFLLGGGIVEMIFAFFGAGAGQLVRKKLIERHITLLANVTAAVAAACCTYMILIRLAVTLLDISPVHQAGYICSMLFVIPGFPLITGGIDLSKLDLRSGLERITYAMLIIIIAALTGWITAYAFGLSPSEFSEQEFSPLLHALLRLIASFCGVYGFSFLFNSRRKMAVTAGIIGMTANTLRLELIDLTSVPPAAAAFIGALSAGLLASAIKRISGYPRITLTVPSIVIMVPGMYMYKGVYYLGLNNITEGAMWLNKALLIVFALPLGLIFARIFTDKNFRRSS